MRRAARRDTTEAEIIGTLEAHGVQCWPCSSPGMPDLWVVIRGERWIAVECKGTDKRIRTAAQKKFHAEARGPVVVLRNATDAREWLKNLNGAAPYG